MSPFAIDKLLRGTGLGIELNLNSQQGVASVVPTR